MNDEEKNIKNEQETTNIEQEKNINAQPNENVEPKDSNVKQESQKKENPKKEKHIIKKVFNIITKIIVWTIIILLCIILVRIFAFKKYDVFGYKLYLIGSGSMEPTIQIGDAVAIKEADEYNQGDIIAFSEGDMVIVHRIDKLYTEENEKLFQTKGDNNNTIDGGLRKKENIIGKYAFKISNVGKLVSFLKNNMIFIIVLIGIIIIAMIIKGLIL